MRGYIFKAESEIGETDVGSLKFQYLNELRS